ncbi:hypothetical protein EVAR_28620_1 [Eumeta japonica]|uniref:Histone-lysine N-methyltransferase SETMAR n=1 Tax=Eumeta variegata TaxID=151549 RepID=A0A4C1XUN7_EUMVA|nr:hypothetical protein EVAR_28620_1 [Eumeta japonica]
MTAALSLPRTARRARARRRRRRLIAGCTNLIDDLCEGRPSTATTKDNISAVQLMIETNKRVTYQQIQTSGHEHLTVEKLYHRRTPHNLTVDQNLHRVNWCRETMKKFASDVSNSLFDIVTSDESWVYCYDPETKRQSAQLVYSFEKLSTRETRGRSV